MINCTAYKQDGKTIYQYEIEGEMFTKETTGTLAKAEFLACIEALILAKEKGMKDFTLTVNSKGVYVNFFDLPNLAKNSDLFRSACVMKLLCEELGVKVKLSV
jgi:ribonuclease HI